MCFLCSTGAADCVAFLLKRNASVNLRDKIGITALHLAARNGYVHLAVKTVIFLIIRPLSDQLRKQPLVHLL